MTTPQPPYPPQPEHQQQTPYPSYYPPVPPGAIPQQRQPEPPAPKRGNGWKLAVGGLGLFILGVIIGAAGGNDAPAATTAATGGQAAIAAQPAPDRAPFFAPRPAAPPEPALPAGSYTDGVYEVGVEIEPGAYKTNGPDASSVSGACYYARLKIIGGSDIIKNDFFKGRNTMVVAPSDGAVELNHGCIWTKVN